MEYMYKIGQGEWQFQFLKMLITGKIEITARKQWCQ